MNLIEHFLEYFIEQPLEHVIEYCIQYPLYTLRIPYIILSGIRYRITYRILLENVNICLIEYPIAYRIDFGIPYTKPSNESHITPSGILYRIAFRTRYRVLYTIPPIYLMYTLYNTIWNTLQNSSPEDLIYTLQKVQLSTLWIRFYIRKVKNGPRPEDSLIKLQIISKRFPCRRSRS